MIVRKVDMSCRAANPFFRARVLIFWYRSRSRLLSRQTDDPRHQGRVRPDEQAVQILFMNTPFAADIAVDAW